ncbi:MAG TPA: lactate utilization protein C [Nocardioidaceae bacterium]|nr:lactate utilization protein C [Nocardioidaceae bacterium]
MSAREEILGQVRSALREADRGPVDVPRGYRGPRGSGLRDADMVSLFVERVADYRATVERCAEADVPEAVRRALGSRARVLVPEGFPWPVDHGVRDTGLSPQELDDCEAVVTEATVGIAETGTIVLTHGAGQGRRALSLVPDVHLCVVRADQVVAGVPDAVALLDPGRPQTWISGPSATSDIELNRVEGVHGPRTLHVVVVE